MIFQSFQFSCSSSGTQPPGSSASGSDYPDRDRAACAVGAEETGHVAGAGRQGETVDGGDRAVAFGELLCFDHVWHARSGRLGGASVTVTGFGGWSCPAVR
jgi:hypothetical protein